MPSDSDDSHARLTDSLIATSAGSEYAAMRAASARASGMSASGATTRDTRPQRSASAASSTRAARHISIALALPMARGRRWVPPAPGSMASLTSGSAKRADSAASTMSQASASSQPPP
ncbi:hypothetical protein D3C86_818240 [compost metagenome]